MKHGTDSKYTSGCRCGACKAAHLAYYRKWSAGKEAHINVYRKQWRRDNPNSVKNTKLKIRFGITLADYTDLLQKQNGLCAICKTPPKEKCLAVDHNHTTGKVRALLCTSCNTKLGWYENNKDIVDAYILNCSGLLG